MKRDDKKKIMLQSSDALTKAKVPRRNQSSLNQQEGSNVQSEADDLDKHANWGGGGKKKLLYRRWSSFLWRSVVTMSGWRGPRNCASLMAAGGRRGPSAWGAAGLRGGGAIRRRRRRPSSWWVTNARRPAAGVCSAAWSRARAGASWTLEPRGRGTRRLSALGGSLWTSPPVSVRGRGAEWVTRTRHVSEWARPLGWGRVGGEQRPCWISWS